MWKANQITMSDFNTEYKNLLSTFNLVNQPVIIPKDEDGLYHHLFIEVSLSGNGASDDVATTEDGAFETLGVKEYEAVSLDGIDTDNYKPVGITDEYIIFTSAEETAKEHFL